MVNFAKGHKSMGVKGQGRRAGAKRRLKAALKGAHHVVELVQRGRLGAPYSAPFEVEHRQDTFALRRYHTARLDAQAAPELAPILLIPPLMVTTEVYDISPELSAVTYLAEAGVDVWAVDFGAPEEIEGGLKRTLDDHILAVALAVQLVRERTGQDVHLAGYSQGGLFAYQGGAYLRGEGVASIITFGSPVDLRRTLPVPMHDELAGRLLAAANKTVSRPLEQIEGLPGALTSRGFKVLNASKELKQVVDFFGMLHDRQALERREPKRLFLGGEGFVAWPGPALRQFMDEMVAHNRLAQGGLVVNGEATSMADLRCPILYFVGTRDELARPASVRAVRRYSPEATHTERLIEAGHFGLVVGSKAMTEVWPTVIDWITWRAGLGPAVPELTCVSAAPVDDAEGPMTSSPVRPLYDLATEIVDGLWTKLGDASLELTSVVDTMRWQLPRLARLRQLADDEPLSISQALQEQAHAIPERTFLLWRARAYTYAQADARVNQVARALLKRGVTPGTRVALWMSHPGRLLTLATAINRIGAVAAICPAQWEVERLIMQLEPLEPKLLICDAARLSRAPALEGAELVSYDRPLEVDSDIWDLEAATLAASSAPLSQAHEGLGGELALVLWSAGTTGEPKAARMTNRRWVMAALGAAAASQLTTRDTVYCSLPLYHPMGLLVAASGALVGGARLALEPTFEASTFWSQVRRCGATVVFYTGGMCSSLLASPALATDRQHPVRTFVGSGLHAADWRAMLDRFGPVRILEFYASCEGNLCLVNLDGHKVGSMGRALPGLEHVEVVRWDVEAMRPTRDAHGRIQRAEPDEPGMMIARVDIDHALTRFDGYWDRALDAKALIEDVEHPGDVWFVTGDLVRRDQEGDFWFVGRASA